MASGDAFLVDINGVLTIAPPPPTSNNPQTNSGDSVLICPSGSGEVAGIRISNGMSLILPGIKGYRFFEKTAVITGWKIVADEPREIIFKLSKGNYSSYPSTTLISGTTNPPSLAGAVKSISDNLAEDWVTIILPGEFLCFEVISSTLKSVTLVLTITYQ